MFQAIFFIKYFDKKFSFVILHKQAKFHSQAVFTDDIMTFEYLKS